MNGLNKSLCGQRLVNIKPHNGKRVENSSARGVFLKKLISKVAGHKSSPLEMCFLTY